MKFRYTILYVDDVAATLAFYTKAFGMTQKMLHESGDYGVLETGETQLCFASRSMIRDTGIELGPIGAPTFEVGLETDDVQGSFDRAIAAGAKAVSPLETKPWGQTVSYVSDLNGFLVEICSPIGS